MKMTVEQLIAERSYSSLTPEEKKLVSELCADEQEFNAMKQFFVSMSSISAAEAYEPSKELKSSLDSVFAARHGGIGARLTPREVEVAPVTRTVPLYRQTWARVAAGVLVLAGVLSVWQLTGEKSFGEKKISIAKNETVTAPTPEPAIEQPVAQTRQKEKAVAHRPSTDLKPVERPLETPEPAAVPNYGYAADAISASAEFSVATTTVVEEWAFAKMKEGIDADLYPAGRKDQKPFSGENASAVSASQEDLLSYIVPAF